MPSEELSPSTAAARGALPPPQRPKPRLAPRFRHAVGDTQGGKVGDSDFQSPLPFPRPVCSPSCLVFAPLRKGGPLVWPSPTLTPLLPAARPGQGAASVPVPGTPDGEATGNLAVYRYGE